MKRIAISQRVDHYPERNETRDALDQQLLAFVLACGGLPLPVPNVLGGTVHLWLDALQPAAVLLSGGNDIGLCAERDATERALLNYAEARRLPLLGICRGMQMMAHHADVALQAVSGHVRTRHCLQGEISGTANSYHNHALAACPPEYRVLATSEDGSIEAIAHENLPWEGWMWHPEREHPFMARDIERARRLFA